MEHLKLRLLNSALALSLLLRLLAPTTSDTLAKGSRLRLEPRLNVAGLRTEYKEDPIGIDVTQPRLSWQLQSLQTNERSVSQAAYQVRVASSQRELQLGRNLVWDSGEVRS